MQCLSFRKRKGRGMEWRKGSFCARGLLFELLNKRVSLTCRYGYRLPRASVVSQLSMTVFCKPRYCLRKNVPGIYVIYNQSGQSITQRCCVKQFQMWTLYIITGIAFGGPVGLQCLVHFPDTNEHLPVQLFYWSFDRTSYIHKAYVGILIQTIQTCSITVPYSPMFATNNVQDANHPGSTNSSDGSPCEQVKLLI